MSSRIHPQARTTPKTRQEIKDSGLSDRQAAKVFNISRATAKKWLKRDDVQDRSHRAHVLKTTLSAAQETIVLVLRQSLYLPLDDLLFVTKQYINPDVSRSGLARLLKREGMSRLEDVIPKAEDETIAPKKTFKDYPQSLVEPEPVGERSPSVDARRMVRLVRFAIDGGANECARVTAVDRDLGAVLREKSGELDRHIEKTVVIVRFPQRDFEDRRGLNHAGLFQGQYFAGPAHA